MRLADITGNESVRGALEGMVLSGRIPHAIMFYENDGGGAMALVLAFLDAVFGHDGKVSRLIHPDVHFIFPIASGSKVEEKTANLVSDLYLPYWRELVGSNPYFTESGLTSALGIQGKVASINVADANSVLYKLSLTAVEGGYKAVVVYLPEKMNAQAANRLLKVIEEPPEKTLFLMITHAPDRVLPTISSRCQGLRVAPLGQEETASVLVKDFGKGEEEAAEAAAMAGGSVGVALDRLSDMSDYAGWMDMFADLVGAVIAKDVGAALDCGEAISSLSSREKQKAFCIFATECLRKLFMVRQGMPHLCSIARDEEDFYRTSAAKLKESFPRRAAAAFEHAALLIDRNVNQKMVFCDLAGKLLAI